MEKKIYCPLYDMDCPYCTKDGVCEIGNPMEECDEYYAVVGDNEEEEDE